MKGLLIKDFSLLKKQLKNYVFIFAIAILISFSSDNMAIFLMGYLALCFSFISVNTLYSDYDENGMAFLLTLPVTRRQYAGSKYIEPLISTIVVCIISTVMYYVQSLDVKEGFMPLAEFFSAMAVIFLVVSIFNGIMIPIYIKYGMEKGRILIMIVSGCIGFLAYVISYLSKKYSEAFSFVSDVSLNTLLDKFMGTTAFYIVMVILITAVYLISMEVSYLLIKGEEY